MTRIYKFIENNEIKYERYDHLPVYTVEDVDRLVPRLPAAETKNLFFRDKKGRRHFLVEFLLGYSIMILRPTRTL